MTSQKQSNSLMRIVLITQDDPFYLGRNLEYLLSRIPANSEIVACVMLSVSPFGKKESFFAKALRTRSIFGTYFFIRYALRFVWSMLDRRYNVARVMARHDIPVLSLGQSINSKQSLTQIADYAPDLLISVAGNEIFRQPLLDIAKFGCLNLHSALLPAYRGLMPSFWVLKNGERETGVSVFFVDEGVDTGPILVQKRVDVQKMTQERLIHKTKILGMDAIVEAIDKLLIGDDKCLENSDSRSSYYSFPTEEDVREFRSAGHRFF